MSTKSAVVKQVRGITFAAKSDSNHWLVMDGPEVFGGSDAGPRPKELILMALGGCTASDVIPILKKKRVSIDGFELPPRNRRPTCFRTLALRVQMHRDKF